jgi:hypothetical protein
MKGITVLLAKLYIDVVLDRRQNSGDETLPQSVPELMIQYLEKINHAIPKVNSQ